MNKLVTLILSILSATTVLAAGAQPNADKAHADSLEADMARPDYIQASLLVATPGFELYTSAGHAALRMQCPSKGVDNCYEFASLVNFDTTLEFINGTMEGAFMRLYTRDYIKRYRDEKRGVTEMKLNLTPEQKVELWRLADRHCDMGVGWQFDYMVNDCSNMATWLVESSLLGDTIVYRNLDPNITGTYRKAFYTQHEISPWSMLFWNVIMGTLGDEPTDFKSHIYPIFIVDTWQKAVIVDKHGKERTLTTSAEVLLKQEGEDKPVQPTPLTVMAALLLLAIAVSIMEYKRGYNAVCRITDILLFAVEFATGLLITYLLVFSKQVATEWNWLIIVFNPLPLLLWAILRKKKAMRHLYRIFTAVLVAYCLCTPLLPQLAYSKLYVLLAAFAVRTFTQAHIPPHTPKRNGGNKG